MAQDRNQAERQGETERRGPTVRDQKTQRAVEREEGSAQQAMETAPEADRDVQSGGRTSKGSVNSQSEGTDQGSSHKQ